MYGLCKRLFILCFLLFPSIVHADRIGMLNSEADGNPSDSYAYKVIWPNGSTSIVSDVLTVSFASGITGVDINPGNVTVGTTSAGKNATINATQTPIHTFTSANWNDDGVTWTMGATGPLVHVTGNTTTVTATNTEVIVGGTSYRVQIAGTGSGGTATYTLGGVQGTTIAASGAIAIDEVLTASSTASLIITPASACTVSLTSISIHKLPDGTGDLTVWGNLYAKSPAYFSGNVGIGTASPGAKLQIDHQSDILGQEGIILSFPALTTSQMGLRLSATGDLNIDRQYSSTWSNALTVQRSTGNVGIGTTAPNVPLEANSATGAGIRVTYNDSDGSAANHGDLTVGSTGSVTLAATGTNPDVILTPAGTGQVKLGNATYSRPPIVTKTGTDSVTVASLNSIVRVTATATLTLPDLSTCTVGDWVIFKAVGAYVITVDTGNVADKLDLDGTEGAGGVTVLSSGASGDQITWVYDTANVWRMVGRIGAWAVGS